MRRSKRPRPAGRGLAIVGRRWRPLRTDCGARTGDYPARVTCPERFDTGGGMERTTNLANAQRVDRHRRGRPLQVLGLAPAWMPDGQHDDDHHDVENDPTPSHRLALMAWPRSIAVAWMLGYTPLFKYRA